MEIYASHSWSVAQSHESTRKSKSYGKHLLCNDGYLQDLRYLADVVGSVLVVRPLRSSPAVYGDRSDSG